MENWTAFGLGHTGAVRKKPKAFPAHAPEQEGAHDAQGLIMKSVTNSATNDAGDCLTHVELVWQTLRRQHDHKVHEVALKCSIPSPSRSPRPVPLTNSGDWITPSRAETPKENLFLGLNTTCNLSRTKRSITNSTYLENVFMKRSTRTNSLYQEAQRETPRIS